MSKRETLRAAVQAVKEVLDRQKIVLTREDFKEVVMDTASIVEKFGEVYEA